MAAGYDGSIRIRALLNHNQFDRGIRSMGNSVNALSGTLKKLAGVVGMAFGVAAIVNFGRESVKAASELSNAWMGLQSIVEGQGRSFNRAKSFVEEYVSDGLVPLTDAVTAYKNLAARGYDDEQIKKVMTALKDAAAFGRQSSYSLGEAVATASEGLKNENSILVDNAGVTKNVAKMWDEYAKSIGATAQNLTQEQKIQAEVNGILEETRFQTGDAAKLVNTYSGQVAMLGYNFQQLKVQAGNAIMPIVQAVLPGINAIISALIKLAKVFAQVTSLLFGKANTGSAGQVSTNEKIASSGLAAADATDKLANSTSGAGGAAKKAAKDMKGVLASFDDLNILATQAADSVGGAAGGIGGAGDIDTTMPELDLDGGALEEVGEKFKSLGEIFRDTLDEMLAAMPAFKQALLDFADRFNEFNKKLYDAFTFPGILDRVKLLGAELADAFNGLVNAIDWELWGRTLGAGLNLALNFLTSLIYGFDWVNLGTKLAEFINGLVYEIDWYEFGRLLWAKFKIALETFAGFVTGLDMPALAKAASDIIMGFFDEMRNTIAKIDWAEIGRQVARFLSNIDWLGILSSVWGAVKEAVLAGFEFLGGVIEEGSPGLLLAISALAGVLGAKFAADVVPMIIQVGVIIGSVFRKIHDVTVMLRYGMTDLSGAIRAVFGPGSVLAGIGMIVGGAVLAFTDFFSMLKNGFNWVNEALMLLGIAITAIGAIILGAPALVAGVIAGIVAAVATAAVLIKEHWEDIKQFAIDAWEKVKEAWADAKKWFGDLWEGIKTAASGAWQAIQDIWNTVSGWFSTNVIGPVKKFFSDLWENVKTLASDAWTAIQEVWSAVSDWFNENVIEPVKTFFSDLWENVKTFASDAWTGIQEIWTVAASWFSENVIEPVKTFFTELWKKVKELASEAWEKVQEIWSVVSNWFHENVVKPVIKFFTDLWDSAKQLASDAWEAVQGVWEKASGWFEEHVTGPLGKAFQAAADFIKGVMNGIIGTVEGMVNAVIKAINWIINQINKLSIDIPDNPITGPIRIGFSIPTVSEVSLPRLANGAVIPPNQQFAAILGDQRSGKNLEAPAGLIRQMVTEGIQAAGTMNNGGNMTVIMEIDGREFGRASYKYGNAERQRVGISMTEVRT